MKNILILMILPLLWSCSSTSYLSTYRMGTLHKGLSYQKIMDDELSHIEIHSEWDLEKQNNSSKYKAVVYKYFVREVNYIPKGFSAFPLLITPGTFKDLSYSILVFKDDKLYHWGFVEDFHRSENIETNNIGLEVTDILTKIVTGE